VKVHVTRQGYQLYQPWKKNNPGSSWQRGVMVRSGYVLTQSEVGSRGIPPGAMCSFR
jgi:hypothetical protein